MLNSVITKFKVGDKVIIKGPGLWEDPTTPHNLTYSVGKAAIIWKIIGCWAILNVLGVGGIDHGEMRSCTLDLLERYVKELS